MHNRIVLYLCVLGLLSSGCRREKPSSAAAQPPGAAAIYEIENIADITFADRLVRGFYEPHGSWRWTSRVFAVSLDAPGPEAPTTLSMDFSLPTELMNEVNQVTLIARVNHKEVGKQTYTKSGRYLFVCNVPQSSLERTPAEVEFELDKSAKEQGNGRELGLIAVSIGLQHSEETVMARETAIRRARAGYQQLLKERDLLLKPEKQQELMKLFHDIPVWRRMWFQNVQIEKNPLDLWMMQQIIYETRPDFIVETGTWRGGSALYWAYTLNGMGLVNSRVLTVDISNYNKTAAANPLWQKYVRFFNGSSTDPAIVSEIARIVKDHKTLVTLDSDHTMKHVLNELHAYSPMVGTGSYLIVEDTHMDGVPTQPDFGPGPYAAVQRFLAEGGAKDFELDLAREALVMTFNPGGWLRRK